MGVANGNVGLAFGLVIAAGLSTTIGSAFVFCSSYANTKLLAAALGVSAGVMIYVSFVEIFSLKAVEGFTTEYGDDASKMATLCFFSGAGITYLLDGIVHRIGAWQKKKSGKAGAVCVCHTEPTDILGERALFSDVPGALELQQPAPLFHPIMKDMIDDPEKENLKNMGVMTAVAIGIHNFPEGLATFVAALADTKLGIALAFPSAAVTPPTGNVGFANFGAAPTQAAVPASANGNFASFGAAPAAPSPTRRRRNLRSPRFRKVLWFSKQCTSMV